MAQPARRRVRTGVTRAIVVCTGITRLANPTAPVRPNEAQMADPGQQECSPQITVHARTDASPDHIAAVIIRQLRVRSDCKRKRRGTLGCVQAESPTWSAPILPARRS
ncbi:hypothetical protein GCM10009533_48670 [Saccharopolyspora spinosporotrichia]|uniref:Uncharacterized protein n=1 Tax=Saccharopolyspora erythraea TaxID=1836 RepID=A0ABN1DHT5_SACER